MSHLPSWTLLGSLLLGSDTQLSGEAAPCRAHALFSRCIRVVRHPRDSHAPRCHAPCCQCCDAACSSPEPRLLARRPAQVPTQAFFERHMGLPLEMKPNYEDFSCQFR